MSIKTTPEEARNVLWFFGDRENGWEAGSFTTKLLSAVSAADGINRHRLAIVFPGLVSAMNTAQYQADGVDKLRELAKQAS